jgi:uncharacterized membrane protein YgcG
MSSKNFNNKFEIEPDMTPQDVETIRLIRVNRPADLPQDRVDRIERLALARFTANRRSVANTNRPVMWQWALALMIVAIFVIASAGTVSAAARSLPGESLYPLKRLTESLQLGLTPLAQQPELFETLAETRLVEIEALGSTGSIPPEILKDMTTDTEEALAGSANLPTEQQAALLKRLLHLSERQEAVLAVLQTRAPAELQDSINQAAQASNGHHNQAQNAILNLGNRPVTETTEPTQFSTVTPQPTQRTVVSNTPKPAKTAQAQTPPGQQKTPPGQAQTPQGQQNTPHSQKPTEAVPTAKATGNGNGGNNGAGGNGNGGDGGNGGGNGGGGHP